MFFTPIQLHIPMRPISQNNIWRHTGRGHFRTAKYNDWEKEFHAYVPTSARRHLKTDVELTVEFFTKNKKGFDVDNQCKPVLDALTHAGVWEDDDQVVSLHAHKHIGHSEDMIVITISEP